MAFGELLYYSVYWENNMLFINTKIQPAAKEEAFRISEKMIGRRRLYPRRRENSKASVNTTATSSRAIIKYGTGSGKNTTEK